MIYKCAVIPTCAVLLLLTAATSGDEKICRVRDELYTRNLWNFYTGYYCYSYTNKYRLNFTYNVILITSNGTQVPGTKLVNGTEFTYNVEDQNSLKFVRKSFKTDHFFSMWKDCCREAVDCCDRVMTNTNINPSKEYPCPVVWDGWTCFDAAKANTIEKKICSKQAYSTDSEVCELESEKTCFPNGTWNQQTNYEVCAMAPVLDNRHTFNVIVLAVATVVAFPSLVIFFSLRTLRKNLRYIFHRNLILVIFVRNLLSIMSKEIIILDALKSVNETNHVMENNGVGCRVLAFFENAAKNGMYACMLADGFYLHKLIVRVFANEPNLMYIYGIVFVLSFLPSIIWAVTRNAHGGADCWMVDDSQDQWIPDGFRIAILAINFLLLLDIIRVMIMKLKRNDTTQQVKATFRATLVLIPLFGVHIIIITNRGIVTSNACEAQDIYYYISYLMEGLQGVMVAILFCYTNSEVLKELKNVFRKFALQLQSRFGIDFYEKTKSRRRTTAATYCE